MSNPQQRILCGRTVGDGAADQSGKNPEQGKNPLPQLPPDQLEPTPSATTDPQSLREQEYKDLSSTHSDKEASTLDPDVNTFDPVFLQEDVLTPAPVKSPLVAPAKLDLHQMIAQLVATNQALAKLQADKLLQDAELARLAATRPRAKDVPRDGRQTAAEPSKFDGTKPRKLADFLTANELRFLSAPCNYPIKTSKVVAVASFLSGAPFQWFRNQMNKIRKGGIEPNWYFNYEAFVLVLETKFGPKDLTAQAKRDMWALPFYESKGVADFNICFDKVADRLDWNDAGFLAEYKKHLPSDLKERINARDFCPTPLEAYQALALDVEDRMIEDANDCKANANAGRKVKGTTQTTTVHAKVTKTSSGTSLSGNALPHPNACKADTAKAAVTGRLMRHSPDRNNTTTTPSDHRPSCQETPTTPQPQEPPQYRNQGRNRIARTSALAALRLRRYKDPRPDLQTQTIPIPEPVCAALPSSPSL